MIVRSIALFTRRLVTALALGTIAVPATVLAAEPAPAAAVAPAASRLVLVDAAIATAIEDRKPVGGSTVFDTSTASLYAWVKVKNLGDPTTITMVWKKEGKKKLAVELPVGRSIGWQTWSKKGIGPKGGGAWTVDVLDAEGLLVGSIAFQVEGGTSIGAK